LLIFVKQRMLEFLPHISQHFIKMKFAALLLLATAQMGSSFHMPLVHTRAGELQWYFLNNQLGEVVC